MTRKTLVRTIVYCLTVLMLAVNVTGVAASPGEHKVFTVSPTGVDDTAHILKAFADAQKAGPGATVQFTRGTFITDLINVVNFNGFVKGMGQDKTIITPKSELSCPAAIEQGYQPSLFRFSEGSIQVSDLTLQFDNPDPCAFYSYPDVPDGTKMLYAGFTFTGPTPLDMTEPCSFIKKGKVDATVDRVSVHVGENVYMPFGLDGGGNFEFQDQNPCLWYGYNVETHLKVTNSYFEASLWPVVVQNVDGGSLVITGNKLVGGVYTLIMTDIANAHVLISDNTIENSLYQGISLAQVVNEVPVAPSDFVVRNNKIKVGDGWGVFLIDNAESQGLNPLMNILVEGNQFNMNGVWGLGVFGMGVHNAKILNNTFTGQGSAAIVNGFGTWFGNYQDVGWLISGNNLRSLTVDPAGYGWDKITLGPYSSNCKVVTDSTDNVLDQGTNNVIIGGRRHSGNGHAPDFHQPPMHWRHHR